MSSPTKLTRKLSRRYSSSHIQNSLSIIPTLYNKDSDGKDQANVDQRYKPSREQEMAPTNKIKSTRYTALTFLPIALFLQYKKVVVCFYTFNTVMQSLPAVSTNSPLASGIPVAFVILVGMAKEAYLEYKRWKADKTINEKPCRILNKVSRTGAENTERPLNDQSQLQFEDSQVQLLAVGDIIQLKDDDYVPADCVLLQAQYENGQTFTQTDALDGERNFKSKLPLPQGQEQLAQMLADKKVRMFIPEPTTNLYDFKGSIDFNYASNDGDGDRAEDLGNTQFIPRGSVIKNSGNISCMVVYTGQETKLMQNLGSYIFKRSEQEKRTGVTLLVNLGILITFIISCSIWNFVQTETWYSENHYYFLDKIKETATELSLQSIVSFYLLFNYLIPLDLAVMIEFNAIFYSGFISADAKMTHANTQMNRVDWVKTNTLNLMENLAEVQYIMSDKTGTLTQNELTFVAVCSKLDSSYLWGQTTTASQDRENVEKQRLADYLAGQEAFLKCLTICHDCTLLNLTEKDGSVTQVLTGSSLDEQCLLNQVKKDNIASFKSRTAKSVHIQIGSDANILDYDILAINEFSSERKLMSVIVKDKSTGQHFCFAKGAESTIMARLSDESSSGALKQKIDEEVFRFGSKGLRTLVFAVREMTQEEINQIDFSADQNTISEACEKNLTVIACTGVEDELQEDVEECINEFREAGIKFWMLTGDLGHTAQEIGYNCGVISRDEQTNSIFKLEANDGETLSRLINEHASSIENSRRTGKSVSVLVSGQAFYIASRLDARTLEIFQRNILLSADSVILYRSSPKQKAEVVDLVRKLQNDKLTLAIGDGFNDVNMIQSAHIGIGVQGKESNQAAAFADYAVVKFRDLRRLMFWHGRSYGHKTLFFILLNFYKVWGRIWTTFIMNSSNGMSAVTDIFGLYYALFAVCMCNYLVIWWTTDSHDVDQRKDEKQLGYRQSDLYAYCRNDIFRYHKYYFVMIVLALLPDIVVTFSFFECESSGAMNEQGQSFGYLMIGLTSMFQGIFVHYLLLMVMQHNFDLPWLGFFIFSSCWVFVVAELSDINPLSVYYYSIYTTLWKQPLFWIIICAGLSFSFMPIYGWLKHRQFLGGDPRHDISYKIKYNQQKLKKVHPQQQNAVVQKQNT